MSKRPRQLLSSVLFFGYPDAKIGCIVFICIRALSLSLSLSLSLFPPPPPPPISPSLPPSLQPPPLLSPLISLQSPLSVSLPPSLTSPPPPSLPLPPPLPCFDGSLAVDEKRTSSTDPSRTLIKIITRIHLRMLCRAAVLFQEIYSAHDQLSSASGEKRGRRGRRGKRSQNEVKMQNDMDGADQCMTPR